MKRPNVYKGIMGVMDLTYKELSVILSDESFNAGDISEICRAVRGYSGPKYDKIRKRLVKTFSDWVAKLDEDGEAEGLRPYVKIKNISSLGEDRRGTVIKRRVI